MSKSISELVMEYFKDHPGENLKHGPVVDWVTKEYIKDKINGHIQTPKI